MFTLLIVLLLIYYIISAVGTAASPPWRTIVVTPTTKWTAVAVAVLTIVALIGGLQ